LNNAFSFSVQIIGARFADIAFAFVIFSLVQINTDPAHTMCYDVDFP